MGSLSVANRRIDWAVPDEVLEPILSAMHVELGKCCDNFIDYEWDRVKEKCGPDYAGVPRDDIRRQGVNLRKKGVLSSVNGHGPSKARPLSEEYKAILKSVKFRAYFIEVCELFGNRCAVCNNGGHLDPHHRTYERLGNETGMDCIPVCRKCHKVCDIRRQRQANRPTEATLF